MIKHITKTILAICLVVVMQPIWAADTKAADVIAINILLIPDDVMTEKAEAANTRLLENFSRGFALDANHVPHITTLQIYVHKSDLEKVYAAVKNVVEKENPIQLELIAKGYYFMAYEELGLAGITVNPTPQLLNFQRLIIEAVEPFKIANGSEESFETRYDNSEINQPTVDYVHIYSSKYKGKNYNPHVTVGLGQRTFVEQMLAEPFEPFGFKVTSVDIYQLGNFGTAQTKLWSSTEGNK